MENENINKVSLPNHVRDILKYIDRFVGKLTNQVFTGVVNLGNDLTHYANYSVTTNLACTIKANPIIGGSAEIRMIADGSHTPTFVPFVKSSSSADYDTTLNKVNKIIFYYDGTDAFYSITIL